MIKLKDFKGPILLLFLLSAACSHYSDNFIKEGKYVLSEGIYKRKIWKTKLTFKRYSWYKEITMRYDLLLSPFDQFSKFNHWFSSSELKRIKQCTKAYIGLSYSLDTDLISSNDLFLQYKKYGYEKISIPNFARELKAHPDSTINSLNLYQAFVLCHHTTPVQDEIVYFPGYQSIKLN